MDGEPFDGARRIAEALTPGDLEATLAKITAVAVEVVPDVAMASITIRHGDGRLETFAPTDDVLLELDARQYELQQGPCYDAATDEAYVVSSDLAADPRWPDYTRSALTAGVRAQAAIRLFEAQRSQGALNLYAHHVGAFEDLGPLGALFSHQAGIAIGYAQEVSDLRRALATRQEIGAGVGVVMERYQLSEEKAFAFLVRLSSNRNVKLREIAREFTDSTDSG